MGYQYKKRFLKEMLEVMSKYDYHLDWVGSCVVGMQSMTNDKYPTFETLAQELGEITNK